METVKTICGMCGADHCGIDVTVEDGQIVAIKGTADYPANRGRLCPQARAAVEQMNDPQRLDYPLLRQGNTWQHITWDEALDRIAARLGEIKVESGAQSLVVYQGRALLQLNKSGWARRFMNLYGSPNFATNDHMCAIPTYLAEKFTCGAPTVWGIEAEHTRCILLWGCQPSASFIPTLWRDLNEALRRGASLIVVDPRQTPSASRADLHAPLRPGTDTALALGLIHVIIRENLYDADFVRDWTTGFDALARHVEPFTPEVVAGITGVDADTIRQIARLYATTKPASLQPGNALEQLADSWDVLHALVILRAITGNIDVPGGDVLMDPLPMADVSLRDLLPSGLKRLGSDRYPLFADFGELVPGNVLTDTLLTGEPYPVRAMIMLGGNPLLTWPNAARLEAGLERLDLLVVMDLYMTATARKADIVLPAASSLEKTQLVTRAGHYGPNVPLWHIALKKQVVDPGGRRSEWWFWKALAERMGYGAHYPWQDERDAVRAQLAPLGITLEELEANPLGMPYGGPPAYCKYQQTGFNTPSGRVELYSHVAETAGYHPLPVYSEPPESPVSTPDLAASYPLVLTVGANIAVYTASRHRTLPSLRSKAPEPVAEIHPQTAQTYGIADGDRITVESPRGAVTLKAQVTSKIRPAVVSLNHGWEEANGNLLTDEHITDPMLAAPSTRASLCRISKAP